MRRLGMVCVGMVCAILALPDSAPASSNNLFTARLNGGSENPPRRTPAGGFATFELNDAGDQLSFCLEVQEIKNVFGAHIHLGSPKVNGPILVGLFAAAPGGGPFEGKLAQGQISRGGTLSETAFDNLIAQMRAGNTYVNDHTNDGIAPPNTGPGDFPGGEIRGQIIPPIPRRPMNSE